MCWRDPLPAWSWVGGMPSSPAFPLGPWLHPVPLEKDTMWTERHHQRTACSRDKPGKTLQVGGSLWPTKPVADTCPVSLAESLTLSVASDNQL